MKITYLGHSAFIIEGNNFKALIDPFVSGNPNCPVQKDDLTDITHIFVTHGHGDHLGNTIEIAKRCNSKVICNFELGHYISSQDQNISIHTMHIGGRTKMDIGTVKMTQALHGSGVFHNGMYICGGNPCGFVVEAEGKKIYHAGDTGLTIDMKLLSDEEIDVAMLPIGGNFTMDIYDAVKAVEFIQPKIVIPMHYNTFNVISANPQEFREKVTNADVKVLEYGGCIEL